MRKVILAPALVLAMSVSAFADGDMQFGITGPPAPKPHAGFVVAPEEADDLTETLLSLIDSVLALF